MFIYTHLFYSDHFKKKRRPEAGTPGTPETTHRPLPLKVGSQKKRMDTMQFTTQKDLYELSGRARVRAFFHPLQKVGLLAAGPVLGLSYPQLHRRIQQGKLSLRIRRDEYGQMYVNVDDLAAYLFPDEGQQSPPSPPVSSHRGPGRPRKAVTRGSGKGGAR